MAKVKPPHYNGGNFYMETNVQLIKEKSFLGRNGMFKMKGIRLISWDSTNEVRIVPITSKDEEGRAALIIDRKDIPALIEELKKHL